MQSKIDWSRFRDSGDLFLPPQIQTFLQTHLIGTPTSVFYITYWSILHIISGVFVGMLLGRFKSISAPVAFLTALLIHTLWEAWQVLITRTPNTVRGKVDTVVDTVLFMIGFSFIYSSHFS
jgi:hypothetical protein